MCFDMNKYTVCIPVPTDVYLEQSNYWDMGHCGAEYYKSHICVVRAHEECTFPFCVTGIDSLHSCTFPAFCWGTAGSISRKVCGGV